jgi:hypothetical protein
VLLKIIFRHCKVKSKVIWTEVLCRKIARYRLERGEMSKIEVKKPPAHALGVADQTSGGLHA